MNKKINEIKDRIYEAEGLLELLQLRGDRLGDLKPLILARIDEARTRIAALDAHFEVKEEKETEDVSEPEPSGFVSSVRKEVEETLVSAPAPEPVVAAAVKGNKPAFCLNDRFRFRRAIFAGSQEDFNTAMDHLATLDSYDEAEAFFIGDMALDPEDPDVIDFMNIIKEYFG